LGEGLVTSSHRRGRVGKLVAENRGHASEAHGMTLTSDETLLLVFRAELNEKAPLTIPRETKTRTKREET
jgi:hypothetical protein